MNAEETLIRPSTLPKLACCRCYKSTHGSSPAAERGTKLDAILRMALEPACGSDGAYAEAYDALPDEDKAAVDWGIQAVRELCAPGPFSFETREEELAAVVPIAGIKPGTMDGLSVDGGFLVDFKTGQLRNYREQMAAYALACMDAYFADEWTAHLLFVDQQEVVTHRFSREEAESIVQAVVNAPMVPTACEYCSWCGDFRTCPKVMEDVETVVEADLPKATPAALSTEKRPPLFAELKNDHAKAAAFIRAFDNTGKWVDELKSELKESIPAGTSDEYFTVRRGSVRAVVHPMHLGRYIKEMGTDAVLGLFGPVSVSKLKPVWEKYFDKPIPAEIVTEQQTANVLSLKPQKKKA